MQLGFQWEKLHCDGAASGIGAEISLLLAKSGAQVLLVDNDEAGLQRALNACVELALEPPLSIVADVSQKSDVRRMVDATIAQFGKIDSLVTSAGILYRTPFIDIELDERDEVMDTNIRGLFICNQLVVAQMLKQGGGRIVNIASVAGRSISLTGSAHYATSKHAVIGLTRHLAHVLCQQGVRANVFCPGATNTPMIHVFIDERPVARLRQVKTAV